MMYEHGGKYQHFFSKTHVTHIIATNMPESKIKDLKRFVNPYEANDPFLYPLEILGSEVFSRGTEMEHWSVFFDMNFILVTDGK